MKIIKIIGIIMWVLFDLYLLINILIHKTQKERLDFALNQSIERNLDIVNMNEEYYTNLRFLIDSTDCNAIADSIFENSYLLKAYDNKIKTMK